MNGIIISSKTIEQFETHLRMEEKSKNTIEKYIRDINAFTQCLDGKIVCKEIAIQYKNALVEDGYAVRSINSIIASINALFSFMGLHDCKLKYLKLQQQIYCPEEK